MSIDAQSAVHVYPQLAEQRFALAAENIGATPWGWKVKVGDITREGQASFRTTAYVKAWAALALVRHRSAIYAKTEARIGRR